MLSHPVLQREFANAATPRHLGLALSLTEQCNFRCTYCYESFEFGAMSEEIYSGLMAFATRTIPTLASFSLNWFGGEPLLEWRRMANFTRYCRTLANEHGVKMPAATVPTNAWGLTPHVLGELVSAGIGLYMISLDGTADTHDQTRKRISGRGTFDRIYKNLLAAAQSDETFELVLRLHLHADNIDSQRDLVQQLARDFGADERFKLQPIALGNFGGETVKVLNLLQRGQSDSIPLQLRNMFRPSTSIDAEETAPPVKVCYAAKPNHIFIRPNGRLAKCTSALDRPDNDVGHLLPTGELEMDESKALLWSFGFQTGKAADLSCPFFTKQREQPMHFHPKPGGESQADAEPH